jgi:hypothetical protein
VERVEVGDAALDVVLEDGVHAEPARGVQEAGRRTGSSKDGRFGVGYEKMTWHGGTHELGRRIGKLLEQIYTMRNEYN